MVACCMPHSFLDFSPGKQNHLFTSRDCFVNHPKGLNLTVSLFIHNTFSLMVAQQVDLFFFLVFLVFVFVFILLFTAAKSKVHLSTSALGNLCCNVTFSFIRSPLR